MYPVRDESGKIVGHTRWPNHQTDKKADMESAEWKEYQESKTYKG
jgi:hypothetical protein